MSRPKPLPDLETLARRLHHSGIYMGLQTAPHGMMVWITYKIGRNRKDHLIEFDGDMRVWVEDERVESWLHRQALELFPTSVYARLHSGDRLPKDARRFKR